MKENIRNHMTVGDARAYLDRSMSEPGFRMEPKFILQNRTVFGIAYSSLIDSHSVASGYALRLATCVAEQGCDDDSLDALQQHLKQE